jgi:hypothetical protein
MTFIQRLQGGHFEAKNQENLERLREGKFDFLDLGCRFGGSVKFGMEYFEGRSGVGVDVDRETVISAWAAGVDAIAADASQLALPAKIVRFVLMMDFLEHLPGFGAAQPCLQEACRTAREFVFLRQPYFDADGYLFRRKLKFYWSDWEGHPFHMTSLDAHNMLSPLLSNGLVTRFALYLSSRVEDSYDHCIHSIWSETDQHDFDPEVHPPKPFVAFERPLFRQMCVLATLSESVDFHALEKRFPWDVKIFDSAKGSNRVSSVESLARSWRITAPLQRAEAGIRRYGNLVETGYLAPLRVLTAGVYSYYRKWGWKQTIVRFAEVLRRRWGGKAPP